MEKKRLPFVFEWCRFIHVVFHKGIRTMQMVMAIRWHMRFSEESIKKKTETFGKL